MKRPTKFAVAAVAAFGVAAVAEPVIALQAQMQHGGMMGDGMMGDGMGVMGMSGGMGTMGNAMAAFDTNKDGTISPEEMTAVIMREIKTYDTEGNGKLSLDKFAVMHAAHMRPMTVRAFQMHDADGDAQVTEAELPAMATMMKDQMGAQHEGMSDMGKGTMDNN